MTDPIATELHHTLLRMAGWAQDDVLAQARARLADGQPDEATKILAFAGRHTVLPLTDDDLDLLEELFDDNGVDPRLLDAIELAEAGRSPHWRFVTEKPGADEDGDGDALMAVLAADDLVTALADEPGALGLWRAWRLPGDDVAYPPPRPVYVVETDGHGDLPALTGRLQERLISSGDLAPRVEVTEFGEDVPAYQLNARKQGSLLWTAEPAPELAVARVFDEIDPETGPRFRPDHPKLTDDEERGQVLAHLMSGSEVVTTIGEVHDVVDPSRGMVVPTGFRTDGVWIWPEMVTYYLAVHHLAPEPGLLRHIQEYPVMPDEVDAVVLHHAMAKLASHVDVGMDVDMEPS